MINKIFISTVAVSLFSALSFADTPQPKGSLACKVATGTIEEEKEVLKTVSTLTLESDALVVDKTFSKKYSVLDGTLTIKLGLVKKESTAAGIGAIKLKLSFAATPEKEESATMKLPMIATGETAELRLTVLDKESKPEILAVQCKLL